MSVDYVPPMRGIKSNQLNMAATHTHTHRGTLDVICRVASCIDLLSEEGQRVPTTGSRQLVRCSIKIAVNDC